MKREKNAPLAAHGGRTSLQNRPRVKAALPGVSTPTRPRASPPLTEGRLREEDDISTRKSSQQQQQQQQQQRSVMRRGGEAFSPQTSTHTPLHLHLLLHHHPATPDLPPGPGEPQTSNPPPNTARTRPDLPGRHAQKSPISYLNPQSHARCRCCLSSSSSSASGSFSSSSGHIKLGGLWSGVRSGSGPDRYQRHALKSGPIIQRRGSESGAARRVSPIHTQPASAWLGSVCPCSATASPPSGPYHCEPGREGAAQLKEGRRYN